MPGVLIESTNTFRSRGPDSKLDVRINSMGGNVCTISAMRSWMGSELKSAVAKKTGIPDKELHLFKGTTMIRDNAALADQSGGDGGLDVTMVRHRPIRLGTTASPAEWFALYVYELGKRPNNANELLAFGRSRGGYTALNYREAAAAVALHLDPHVPLADLPEPEPERVQPPPVATERADASYGVPGGAHAVCAANYREVDCFQAGEECPICFRAEVDNDHVVELFCPGSHRFHMACVEAWFRGTDQPEGGFGGTGEPEGLWIGPAGVPNQRPCLGRRRSREDCPVCRCDTRRDVAAKASGVFVRRPGKSSADAAVGRQ